MSSVLPEHILSKMAPADRAKLGKAGLLAYECHQIALAKSEKELQGQIENMLRLADVHWPMRQRTDKRSNLPLGTPDILFVFRGVPVAWEIKMPGQKPREDQERAMRDMTADGWKCAVVKSYDEALALLAEIRKGEGDA